MKFVEGLTRECEGGEVEDCTNIQGWEEEGKEGRRGVVGGEEKRRGRGRRLGWRGVGEGGVGG